MNLPIGTTIDNMEVIHVGNIDEYSKKYVQHKNTGNTSSNQKYQLILKSELMKADAPVRKFFDINCLNTSSYNADFISYFRLVLRFGLKDNGEKVVYTNMVDDFIPNAHINNELDIRCITENIYNGAVIIGYKVYIYAKTYETSTAYKIIPNFIRNNEDIDDIIMSGDVLTLDEMDKFVLGKELIQIESVKLFNDTTINGNLKISKIKNTILPATTGGTNGLDIGAKETQFRGGYFSNFIKFPCQSTAGRPTTTSVPPVSDGMTIFDSSIAKIITYWKGNWYSNGEVV